MGLKSITESGIAAFPVRSWLQRGAVMVDWSQVWECRHARMCVRKVLHKADRLMWRAARWGLNLECRRVFYSLPETESRPGFSRKSSSSSHSTFTSLFSTGYSSSFIYGRISSCKSNMRIKDLVSRRLPTLSLFSASYRLSPNLYFSSSPISSSLPPPAFFTCN